MTTDLTRDPVQPGRIDFTEPSSGVPEVETALTELSALEGAPVEDHVVIYERAQHTLQTALSDADPA